MSFWCLSFNWAAFAKGNRYFRSTIQRNSHVFLTYTQKIMQTSEVKTFTISKGRCMVSFTRTISASSIIGILVTF